MKDLTGEGAQAQTLQNSPIFSGIYELFGSNSDDALILRMSQISFAFIVFQLITAYLPAPYGKNSSHSKWGWIYGPPINARISWIVQETGSWLVPILVLFTSPSHYIQNRANLILVILFITHYVHRSLIFPFQISGLAKPVPFFVGFSALVYTSFNGLFQSHHLLNVYSAHEESKFFYAGVILFVIGMATNIHHDRLLLSLKKSRDKSEKSDKTEYKIPRGGLFEFISGANYGGEILEWWGFAVASGGVPQFFFALSSTVFLGIRAYQTHSFYLKTFGKHYPHSRKAIIPFIL